MPDPTTTHPVDALLPVIRAALLRAYDHGATDAVQKLVSQIAPAAAPQRKMAYGSQRASILAAVNGGADTARKIATQTNIKPYRVAQELAALAQEGRVVRVETGRYAPATQVQS